MNTNPGPANGPLHGGMGYTRRDFHLGEIVSIPFHTANTNPHVQSNDRRLAFTCEGPVYSKRRMAIVLWIYERDMFCIPLYTHDGTGLRNKSDRLRQEYVCVVNARDEHNFYNQGFYDPLLVNSRRPFHPDTAAHMAAGFRVACNDDIQFAGRITETS
jgi:hypothetical protein